MKFTELDPVQWDALKPYVDTALIPVFPVFQHPLLEPLLKRYQQLNDVSTRLEKALTGRLLLFPTHLYPVELERFREEMIRFVSAMGLKYHVFLFYEKPSIGTAAQDHLFFVTEKEGDAGVLTEYELSAAVDRLIQRLIACWSK